MANSLTRAATGSAKAKLAGAVAPGVSGAAVMSEAVDSVRKKRLSDISAAAARRLWDVISATAASKAKLIAAFLKDAPQRMAAVAKKHLVKSVGIALGFKDDQAFLEYLAQRLLAMKARDASAAEFLKGSVGRQNAFLGVLLELALKYGPFRKVVLVLTTDARNVLNADIVEQRAKGSAFKMRNAKNKEVPVDQVFSPPLMANVFEIDTAEGAKAFIDFGGVSFNSAGQWALPLPIEIKLPRAASGVAAQMAAMLERLSAAMSGKRKVFAFFDPEDAVKLEKLVGKAAILGTETRDGRPMIKVELDPAKLLFNSDDIYGSLSRNQMLVRPDARTWNPADPLKLPAANPEPAFSIATLDGREVNVEMSATSKRAGKQQGFNFWRVLIPVKREFLVDVYRAIFGVDR